MADALVDAACAMRAWPARRKGQHAPPRSGPRRAATGWADGASDKLSPPAVRTRKAELAELLHPPDSSVFA
jgi:hypothetical protein